MDNWPIVALIWAVVVVVLLVVGTNAVARCGAVGASTGRPCDNNAPGPWIRCYIRAHKGKWSPDDRVALKWYGISVVVAAVGLLVVLAMRAFSS